MVTAPNTQKPRLTLGERLRRNPVALKELRSRMRGRRAFMMITLHVVLLSALVSLVYFAFSASYSTFGNPSGLQALGKVVFSTVVGLQLLMLCFIAPALTVGAISAERERQTFDLLRATLLSARSLVLGKLLSALSFTFLLMLAAIPLESLAFLFGGITLEEVFIGSVMLVVTAVAFSALGLFFSSFTKRSLVSTALANGTAILLVVGLPIVLFVVLSLMAPVIYGFGGPPDVDAQIRAQVIQWIIVSITPLAAGITTQAMLASGQGAFVWSMPLSNGNTLQLLSPWIGYVVVYVLLSVILIALSIRFVKRVEK